MKNKLLKYSSVFLTFTMFVSIISIDSSTLAEIIDSTITSAVSMTNIFNDITMTAEERECTHPFIKVTNASTATCTKKANVTFTCPDCGYTKRSYTALGHFYVCNGDSYRAFTYKCKMCSSFTSAPVEQSLELFNANINRKPIRNNNNMYIDVVPDGIINGKDYAKLIKNTEYRLTNPNADETTQRIYKYICEINGVKTLSAQQESTWMGSPDYEMNYIYNNTGKYPAMRGLDYMNDDFYGVNQRAINWWNRGGLVTICWHTGSDFCGEWNDAMNDEVADWSKMLTPGTNEYNAMIAGMDKAARALLELQNNGVTVLWRPFHEFDGGWFWWSKGTARNFTDMWKIMYDRYTNYWHLNNLIWVLGYSHNGTDMMSVWNPGEDYYDIMGADTYDNSELAKLYTATTGLVANGKPLCLHECGEIPSEVYFNNYPWSYFMTWHTTYLTDDNSIQTLNSIYNSERVITLDELSY